MFVDDGNVEKGRKECQDSSCDDTILVCHSIQLNTELFAVYFKEHQNQIKKI